MTDTNSSKTAARPPPTVVINPRGLTPGDVTRAPPGTVIVAADGTALRVTANGGLDPVRPFGSKTIASDPTAVKREG